MTPSHGPSFPPPLPDATQVESAVHLTPSHAPALTNAAMHPMPSPAPSLVHSLMHSGRVRVRRAPDTQSCAHPYQGCSASNAQPCALPPSLPDTLRLSLLRT